MEPATQTIIINVVANVISKAAFYVGKKGKGLLKDENKLRQRLEKDKELTSLLSKAITAASKESDLSGEKFPETLRIFLFTPEVYSIIRQIYSNNFTTEKQSEYANLNKELFKNSLSLHLSRKPTEIIELADNLYDLLLNSCQIAFKIAIDQGILSAHEAQSVARFKLLMTELNTIEKRLLLLSEPNKPDFKEILGFEKKYREQVLERHNTITPPHFDTANKLKMDEIYVAANFIERHKINETSKDIYDSNEFMNNIQRTILLGNPGGGKSTFTQKLCCDFITNFEQRSATGNALTPILIILREYGAQKRESNCSILDFIVSTANSKYQIKPTTEVAEVIEYILLNGRAIVIFDGLDELLDTADRQEISSDVESFCNLYPSIRILVTSREIGYDQAPLDKDIYDTYMLEPFNNDQIEEYVNKWFATIIEFTKDDQKRKSKVFLEESKIVPDLRSNPLMLALMCNLYRNAGYIPKNRPAVYQKCAEMLFERWDKTRGISYVLPFEKHIRPAMNHLANWIYSSDKYQGGVTEAKLIKETTNYLCPRKYEEPEEAMKAAREFIEFCRGRAWVFTDMGTTKEGEKLYQFTHRTFLEFFTAEYLDRNNVTPKELFDILLPRISKGEWDVVSMLAFQIKDSHVEGAADQLLSDLIERAEKAREKEGWEIISFTVRCLEFLIPRPKILKKIVKYSFYHILKSYKKNPIKDEKSRASFIYTYETITLIQNLSNPAFENRSIILSSFLDNLKNIFEKDDEQESELALEIAELLLQVAFSTAINERKRFETDISDLLDINIETIIKLSKSNFWLCISMLRHNKISVGNLIEWYGVNALFCSTGIGRIVGMGWGALSYYALNRLILIFSDEKMEEQIKLLKEIGIFFTNNIPISTFKVEEPLDINFWFEFEHHQLRNELILNMELNPDVLFAAIILIASGFEAATKQELVEFANNLNNNEVLFLSQFRYLFTSRFEKVNEKMILKEIDNLGFSDVQRDTIIKWSKNQICFLSDSPTTQNNS